MQHYLQKPRHRSSLNVHCQQCKYLMDQDVVCTYVCIYIYIYYIWASQIAQVVKTPPDNAEDAGRRCAFNFWVRKITQRRKWQPTQVFCLEIPRTEEPVRLQCMRPQRAEHD